MLSTMTDDRMKDYASTHVRMKPIANFPGYFVTDRGDVYSAWVRINFPKNGKKACGISEDALKKMSPGKSGQRGYLSVALTKGGILKSRYVHHLILEAFTGPRPRGFYGCHNNGDVKNNWISNLRWDSPTGNQSDRITHGTDSRGEKQGASKLTNEAVLKIRKMLKSGIRQRDIAKKFGVRQSAISRISIGRTWRHI